MTDHFALLGQPRVPWLDATELKEAFHRKTLQAHPDVATSNETGDFTMLNEAYQTLQDPKRRLHHLLSLENSTPSSAPQAIPAELADLFPVIGTMTQRANVLLQKMEATSNALAHSLLRRELIQVQAELKTLREKIEILSNESLAHLRQMNSEWAKNPAQKISGLSELYFRFAYLGRWSAQLDELALKLEL